MTKQEILLFWLQTKIVLPPAHGNTHFLAFPSISDEEGRELAVITNTLFSMGEFYPPLEKPNGTSEAR